MAGLPAHCAHCGLIFVSPAFVFGQDAQNMSFTDVSVSCLRCGRPARAVDGTFDFVGDALKVKKAPPRTLAILTVLQNGIKGGASWGRRRKDHRSAGAGVTRICGGGACRDQKGRQVYTHFGPDSPAGHLLP